MTDLAWSVFEKGLEGVVREAKFQRVVFRSVLSGSLYICLNVLREEKWNIWEV